MKTAKYCLDLQGKNNVEEIVCNDCKKSFSTSYNLQEHLKKCKEKKRKTEEEMVKTHEKEVSKYKRNEEKIRKEYDEKLSLQKKEYEERLSLQKKEYEERLLQQKKEYEERLSQQEEKFDKQLNVINTIAMKPTTTTATTKIVNHNNQRILNLNDQERLNNVIKNNVNQSVIKKGQVGLAQVVFNKYLKDENGNQLYRVVDTSRQNFEYVDETGELRTDVAEKKLTDAISKSELTQHVSSIAKDMPNMYNKETGHLESVIQLTNFEEDNSKFRKEIVKLSKSSCK